MKFIILIVGVLGLLMMLCTVNADEPDCTLPPVVGTCRGLLKQFYYNPNDKECQQFNYGGCKGNSNRFLTKDECEAACKK